MTANPVVDFDFAADQTLAQLQTAGWQPDAYTLYNHVGAEDLRAIGGALELTDDDGTTAYRWAHEATFPFTAIESGHLKIAAGTGGTFTGNPSQLISIQSAGGPIANIVLRNDTEGRFETGSGDVIFTDVSWKDGFRNYLIDWSVDSNGQNGIVSLRFQADDGTMTQVVEQPFLNAGVPNQLKLGAGWSSPADTQLRVDFIEVYDEPSGAFDAIEISPSVHHDIIAGATSGESVTGRLNLVQPVVSNTPQFSIVGGSGQSLFEIVTVTDTGDRHFGEIVIANGVTLSQTNSYTLDVQADNAGTLSSVQTITVDVVAETAASKISDSLLSQTRYRTADISDAIVADWMSKIQTDGSFSDLNNDWNTSANRLGSLAEAYRFSTTYQGDAGLRSKIYDATVYWAANVSYAGQTFVNPAWAWPRQIGSVGYYLFDDIQTEKFSSDPVISGRAWEVYDAVLSGSESVITHLRDSEEHFWGGNLGYRLHAMQLRASVMDDYNRPLTQVGGFQRGFVSTASFADIESLMIKGLQPSSGPFSVGLTADGAFSQHVGGGAQLFTFGYGRDWAADTSAASVRMLDTPWSLSTSELDVIADFVLDGMQWESFNGQGDYLAQGRRSGEATTGAYSNADSVMASLINSLETAAGTGQLSRHAELISTRDNLIADTHDLEGSLALWNHDFVLHRSDQFYVSTKMNSVRSSGNETGNNENLLHYHMGDGTTLVMLDGDEYVNARVGWDWHQLPGTTTESRTDALPIRNWNTNNGGLNAFAGVASNGTVSVATFINDRYDAANSLYQYHTVNANKSTFYLPDAIVALGANIDRVGPGQNQPIRTTLNQVEWTDDVTYDVGNSVQTLAMGNYGVQSFSVTSPAWFHHDGIGYVLVPKSGQTLSARLETRATNNDWYDLDHKNGQGNTQAVDIFQLSVDHGTNPSDDLYQYVIVPNITAAEMPAYFSDMTIDMLQNDAGIQAIHDAAIGVTQVVFYQAGSIDLGAGRVLSSDEPAIVMLTDSGNEIGLTVSDPLQSTSLSEITITLSEQLQGTGVTWDQVSGTSTIVVGMSNEITLAGKPVSVNLQVVEGSPPVAVADSMVTSVNTPATIDVLNNDLPLGEVMMVSHGSASQGSVIDNGDGTLTYTPDIGFEGTDTFGYTIALQDVELINDQTSGGDRFGYSVDVDGDYAVVGSYLDDAGGLTNSGSAFVYQRTGATSWAQVAQLNGDLDATDAQSQFGWSVAIDGDTVVVSAQYDRDLGFRSGAAYVFQRDQGGVDNWGRVKKIVGNDTIKRDLFGRSVDISGDTIVVGASVADPVGASSGAAYVFNRDEGGADNWGQVKKLTGSTQAAGDRFGQSVSIDGNFIAVGAFRHDGVGSDSGAAYVFLRGSGGTENWGEAKVIEASDASAADQFGYSVSMSGSRVAIGAPLDDEPGLNQLGSVYVFDFFEGGNNNWGQVAKLSTDDGAQGDRLGLSLAFDGTRIVAGAPQADGGGSDSGRAYLFEDVGGGTWTQTRVLVNDEVTTADQYGIAVAVDGDVAVIGSWFDNRPANNTGGAYAFDLQTDTATVTVTVNSGSSELPLIEDSPAMMNIVSEAALPNVMHENQDPDQAVWQARVWARDRVFAQSMETDDENEEESYPGDLAAARVLTVVRVQLG
ncbi:polysaccharide lyase family 8 super-sandwich domain-containing protein [Rubripirellula amarantea]|uniref:polysaccharide lyase family 8 super-sandwich domain-containing protein n=1 Tax=Rubripirellula amarantea TaxID=2527999 RepID=UPI0013EF4E77|nr:polysaccharide lyase family 8 super-sandwich domain-containing protein [Rubripirellula amarantea]